jgi:hypothetical protein
MDMAKLLELNEGESLTLKASGFIQYGWHQGYGRLYLTNHRLAFRRWWFSPPTFGLPIFGSPSSIDVSLSEVERVSEWWALWRWIFGARFRVHTRTTSYLLTLGRMSQTSVDRWISGILHPQAPPSAGRR